MRSSSLSERRERAGASVRNFGLIWVSGRASGPELELALRARQLWEEIASQIAGTGFRPHGSLTLASSDAELTVLKEAAAQPDAGERGYQLLGPDEVTELNPALRGTFGGGLLGGKDAIVEPRLVPEAIRAYLRAGGPGIHLAAGPRGDRARPAGGSRPYRGLALR